MGAQCAKPNSREGGKKALKASMKPYKLRGMDEKLSFMLTLSDLELHCQAKVSTYLKL